MKLPEYKQGELLISGIINESIVDGPGIRTVVFTQGCYHNCEGCHNPDTHPVDGGYYAKTAPIVTAMKKDILVDGLTVSGGEPFLQPHAVADLVKAVKENGFSVWVYTGYCYEQLTGMKNDYVDYILNNIDVLVDGKFIKAEKSLKLKFRGSKNQRVIDCVKTKQEGRIVLADL